MEPEHFLCLICPIRNEHKLLREFIPYYLGQGVDRIYLVDDRSTKPYDPSITEHPNVQFLTTSATVPTHRTLCQFRRMLHDAYVQVRHKTTWMIVVDADEFITTRAHPSHTIRDELETTFRDADCVRIPWVMFGSSGNVETPESIVGSCLYRWDYDKRHPHPHRSAKHRCRYDKVEVKCIIRTATFGSICGSAHCPDRPTLAPRCIVLDGVSGTRCGLGKFHANLRNRDIRRAYLTCNHYRYYSLAFMKSKCKAGNVDHDYTKQRGLLDMLAGDYNEIRDTCLASKLNSTRNPGQLPGKRPRRIPFYHAHVARYKRRTYQYTQRPNGLATVGHSLQPKPARKQKPKARPRPPW